MSAFKVIRPWHFGFALTYILLNCVSQSPVEEFKGYLMPVIYLTISLALLVIILLVATFPQVFSPLMPQEAAGSFQRTNLSLVSFLDVIATFLLLIAVAAPIIDVPMPGIGKVILIGLCAGLGFTWEFLRWASFYARLGSDTAARLILIAVVFCTLLQLGIDLLPVPAEIGLLIVIALVIPFCMRESLQSVPESPNPVRYYTKRSFTSLRHFFLGVGLFSLALGVIQITLVGEDFHLGSNALAVFFHALEVVVAAGTYGWIFSLKQGLNLSRIWKVVMLFMAAALLLLIYADAQYMGILLSLLRTAQAFVVIFVFLALSDIAHHSTLNPWHIFPLGWLAYAAPFAIGMMTGIVLLGAGVEIDIVISALVLVLMSATLFCFDEASVGNHLLFTELNNPEEDSSALRIASVQQALDEQEQGTQEVSDEGDQHFYDRLAMRCNKAVEIYKLTPREAAILDLLARGRTKSYIADAFIISENTVRGHVKRIYSKLDVHSKQELIDKIINIEV